MPQPLSVFGCVVKAKLKKWGNNCLKFALFCCLGFFFPRSHSNRFKLSCGAVVVKGLEIPWSPQKTRLSKIYLVNFACTTSFTSVLPDFQILNFFHEHFVWTEMRDWIHRQTEKHHRISNSMNHYSQFTALWQFIYHGSGESRIKNPRNC